MKLNNWQASGKPQHTFRKTPKNMRRRRRQLKQLSQSLKPTTKSNGSGLFIGRQWVHNGRRGSPIGLPLGFYRLANGWPPWTSWTYPRPTVKVKEKPPSITTRRLI